MAYRNAVLDLGTMWWFARPKRGEGGAYLEVRYLPSLATAEARFYTKEAIALIEALLDWFYVDNRAKPVTSITDALPVYELLANNFPHLEMPRRPLDWAEWHSLLRC